LSLSSDDDEFFKEWMNQRKQAVFVDPAKVVVDFLAATKIKYAVIGGKAAAFHLVSAGSGTDSDASDLHALATSTHDYDIIVTSKDGNQLVDDLQSSLRKHANVALDEKIYDNDSVRIVLMGITKQGMFDSVVDVHILKPPHDHHFPTEVVKDSLGLKYAAKPWICNELKYSLKYHTSSDELTKAMKRKARMTLLKCL
jgi:hypothetical protein